MSNVSNGKEIFQVVAKNYNLSIDSLKGESRKATIVEARHIVIYFLREIEGRSFTEIGQLLNRDHTTVLYGYNETKKKSGKKLFHNNVEILKLKIEKRKRRKNNILKIRKLFDKLKVKKLFSKEVKETKEEKIPESSIDLLDTMLSTNISDREKEILMLFRKGATLKEIGNKFNVTRERIRQIVDKTLLKELKQKAQQGVCINIKEYTETEKNLRYARRRQEN